MRRPRAHPSWLPLLSATILSLAALPTPATAAVQDHVGREISVVRVQQEGVEQRDQRLLALIETSPGEPLSMEAVRESVLHLFSLGRYEDVQVNAFASADGRVDLVYDLVPLHVVGRIDFRGELGLSEGRLRRVVTERYGETPSIGRAADAARTIEQYYGDHGYMRAAVTPSSEVDHKTERTTLVFTVASGPRVRVGTVVVEGTPPAGHPALLERLDLAPGAWYEREPVDTRLADYADELRRKGYYEAVVRHVPRLAADGTAVDVTLVVEQGPLVRVSFEGDPIPGNQRARLAPIEREGSVDQDLLEDSERRIEAYLRSEGYWKADVTHESRRRDDALDVMFRISRGPQFVLASVDVRGNTSVPTPDLRALVALEDGKPFVEAQFVAGVAAITEHYRRRGHGDVKVEWTVSETDRGRMIGQVTPRIEIVEGPRTVIRSVRFKTAGGLTEQELSRDLRSRVGQPYYRPDLLADREALLLLHGNRGYLDATVDAEPAFGPARTAVDIVFTVRPGPLVVVEDIIIVGNTRTSAATIEQELQVRPGSPLGMADLVESQRRLRALGLFRRVTVTETTHASSNVRDVIITVEEAPPTTVGVGGGIEGGERLRTGPNGQAVERLEFGGRAFVEIGRRNLWGKNRAVNLFTRVSVRPRDDPADPAVDGTGLGFNEYRILLSYREPRPFGWGDSLVTVSGLAEQAVRSSFNYARRGVQGAINRRLSPALVVTGLYEFDRTRLFDVRSDPEEAPFIDRKFPKVRLSTVTGAVLRDTRDDALDPSTGTLVGVDAEVSARGIGSEVGYVKSLLQGFVYRRLPSERRLVFAAGARLGLAAGFAREVPRLDESGQPVLDPGGNPVFDDVDDLPASERFFAGGDTTVRGFALDRLGDEETIDTSGFPLGGNALVILNAELRVPIGSSVVGVAFVDAGNVFARANDLAFGDLRAAVGVGVRYQSVIGPLRVDLGRKLGRLQILGREPEDRWQVHLSFGHAF